MNIILLSGGSGKRLWPLSNDVRSKQFIKLFSRICSVCCIEYINEKSANVGGNQHDKAKNS